MEISAKYWSCDVCGSKTFYDSRLNYSDGLERPRDQKMMPDGVGDMAVICRPCAKTHDVHILKNGG